MFRVRVESNGKLIKYEIQISDNGKEYTPIKEGTLKDRNKTQVIEFEAVTTKHIRLVYKEVCRKLRFSSRITTSCSKCESGCRRIKRINHRSKSNEQ